MATEKPNSPFSGTAAVNYEEYFGPMFFEPYARDVGTLFDPGRVKLALEIGCGSGRVTRHLRRSLQQSSKLIASDISEDMLAIAKEKVKEPGIDWRIVDAQDLPFEDNSVDLVVCYFGYMIVPDKHKALSEANRVLTKGGMLLMTTWDRLENNGASHTFQLILKEHLGDKFPDFYKLPFSLHDPREITDTLRQSGFAKFEISVVRKTTEEATASKTAQAMSTDDHVISKVERALSYKYGENPMQAPLSAVVTRAWKEK